MPVLNVITAWPTLILFAFLVTLNAGLAYFSIYLGDASIYAENGLMENLQALFLALACVGYTLAIPKVHGRHRLLTSFLALLMFAFVFRELDVDKMDVPEIFIFFLAEKGRAFYFVPLVFMFLALLKDIKHYVKYIGLYLSSVTMVYFAIAAVLLIVFSTAFDKKWMGGAYSYYWEEAVELPAAILFFLSAVFVSRDLDKVNASTQ